MLNFDFLEKGLGVFSPPHFVYNFPRRIFLMLYSINLEHFTVWLPSCFPSCDVISLEINFIVFLPFFYSTKESRQKSFPLVFFFCLLKKWFEFSKALLKCPSISLLLLKTESHCKTESKLQWQFTNLKIFDSKKLLPKTIFV